MLEERRAVVFETPNGKGTGKLWGRSHLNDTRGLALVSRGAPVYNTAPPVNTRRSLAAVVTPVCCGKDTLTVTIGTLLLVICTYEIALAVRVGS